MINQSEWIYFAGTSYLGIPHHKEFVDYVREGLEIFGAHYGGSRHSNIQLNVFDQVEEHMAKWLGIDKVLLTSSGTVAGQLVAQLLNEQYDLLYTPDTHTALRLSAQGKVAAANIIDQVLASPQRKIAIFTNSVDALQARPKDWSWLQEIPSNRETIIVVDDSHGIGILGNRRGRGIVDFCKEHIKTRFVIVGSMAKALGIPAGFVAGDVPLIQRLFAHPLFIGSSPPPAPYLYAFLNAMDLYMSQRQKLMENINHFIHQSDYAHRFKYISDFPVFYSPSDNLFDHLQDRELLASSFSYPTLTDPAITRIVINAAHTPEDINHLIQHTNTFFTI